MTNFNNLHGFFEPDLIEPVIKLVTPTRLLCGADEKHSKNCIYIHSNVFTLVGNVIAHANEAHLFLIHVRSSLPLMLTLCLQAIRL